MGHVGGAKSVEYTLSPPVLPPCSASNTHRDDPGYADAIRIESSMGIPVLRHDDKKPGGVAEVLDFFKSESSDGAEASAVSILCTSYLSCRSLF